LDDDFNGVDLYLDGNNYPYKIDHLDGVSVPLEIPR
jgi:hypothetical protein